MTNDNTSPGPGRRSWTPLPSSNRAPTPILSSLDNLAATLGLTSVDAMNALLVDWSDIVGEHLSEQCKPVTLRDQMLTIEAKDQQWATELRWMTALIIERCCDALGSEAVTDVRILRPRPVAS